MVFWSRERRTRKSLDGDDSLGHEAWRCQGGPEARSAIVWMCVLLCIRQLEIAGPMSLVVFGGLLHRKSVNANSSPRSMPGVRAGVTG